MTSKDMHKTGSILAGLAIFPVMIIYAAMLAYLTLKRESSNSSIRGSQESPNNTLTTNTTELEGEPNFRSSQTANQIEVVDIAYA